MTIEDQLHDELHALLVSPDPLRADAMSAHAVTDGRRTIRWTMPAASAAGVVALAGLTTALATGHRTGDSTPSHPPAQPPAMSPASATVTTPASDGQRWRWTVRCTGPDGLTETQKQVLVSGIDAGTLHVGDLVVSPPDSRGLCQVVATKTG